jgi:acetoin:2,6-dichlorophenolindophenol oxidoreductase subunit beta
MSSAAAAPARALNFVGALNDALDVALGLDPTVFLLGEDIADPIGGVAKVTNGLSTKYGPDRVRATPISEQAIVGAAIGAGLAGLRPVAEIMLMDFFAVCMDQVANHAAKLRYMSGGRTNVPITLRTLVGGGAFGAQHSQSLEGWLMNTPGIKIACPSTPLDAKGLLLSCIFDDDPCVFMESARLMRGGDTVDVPAGDHRVPLGEADVKRDGSDITLITWGRIVPEALAAAEALHAHGTSVEVVDLRCLVPLDLPTVLTSVAKTKLAVVAQAGVAFAGPCAEIASLVTEHLFGELEAPVVRLGAPAVPFPAGPIGAHVVPTAAQISHAVTDLA